MQLYLCGQSALDLTRYLRATNDGIIPGTPSRPKNLGGAIHKNGQLNNLGPSAQRMLSHVRGRINALVPDVGLRTDTARLKTQVWTHPIPRQAFINLGNGISLSSPMFLFLQLAPVFSPIDLIMLGLELCGSYSRWKLPPARFSPTVNDEFKGSTFELQPATSAQRLSSFASRMSGERGAVGARAALKYVLNSSASPIESAVYLLLCLPRRLGGWGLPKPVFNARVIVTTSSTTEERYPDLFWPTRSVDVEYQSDYAHFGEWSRYRDSKREVELEAEEISVLPLTRQQLMEADEFIAFATSVRRRLGIRSRPLNSVWRNAYLDLRSLLLDQPHR